MKKTLTALGLAALFASSAAQADFIDQFSVVGSVGGDTVSATAYAVYDSTAGTLTITLTNTTTQVTGIATTLTDFAWDAQAGVTFGQPTTVIADGMATCTTPVQGDYTCSVSALSGYPDGLDPWGINTTNDVTTKTVDAGGTIVEFGAGYKGGSWALFPWGIVNTSIENCTGANDCDGLGSGNNPHQPYLINPTFTIPVTLEQGATFTDLTNVLFTWGTVPDIATSTSTSTGGIISTSSGPISEPNSSALTLLGVAMIGLVFMARSRSRRA